MYSPIKIEDDELAFKRFEHCEEKKDSRGVYYVENRKKVINELNTMLKAYKELMDYGAYTQNMPTAKPTAKKDDDKDNNNAKRRRISSGSTRF